MADSCSPPDHYPPTAPPQAGYPLQPLYQPQAPYSTDPQPPPSGYSEKTPYPEQQTDYPQQAAYPQQTAYPQQGFSGQAPPPPYQQPQQQATSNVVVVHSQPQPMVVARPYHQHSDAGQNTLIFAVVVTVFLFAFGCVLGLLCSAIGIVFAANAQSAARRGEVERAKTSSRSAIGCTIGGIVFGVIGSVVLIGGVVGWYVALISGAVFG